MAKKIFSLSRYFPFPLPLPLRVASTPLKRGDRKSKLTESDSHLHNSLILFRARAPSPSSPRKCASRKCLNARSPRKEEREKKRRNVNRAYYSGGKCIINFSQFPSQNPLLSNLIVISQSRSPAKIRKKCSFNIYIIEIKIYAT